MRLTQRTDYTLRVLMYCAACEGRAKLPTVSEIAEAHGISRSHLMKIVMDLASLGWLETTRGRGGGLRLLKAPGSLSLGEIVRQTESDMDMVECFDKHLNTCRLDGFCRLKGIVKKASRGFIEALNAYTVADLLEPTSAARTFKGQLPHLIPLKKLQKEAVPLP
ncbi:Rrf2 family transcriptional regulator [Rhodoferax sp.]|uniref:Rrf2 family transcriptional regulator n=1 Tax=Rhodoferax sp. TaxID=50421 RepID=UPI0025F99C9A|nr:Rrf2 family transcriptional regulator [Rhodoferax sp.]MCM2296616.1 Rrf2 family transcriptional regulator [Rhodoferax sp.]MDD3935091.1 Rrf2 family transcriptional regulator [Rhodoferax sp.]